MEWCSPATSGAQVLPLAQSRTPKQSEFRRRLAENHLPWRDRLRPFLRWSALIAAGFWIAATIIVTAGEERLPYFLNQNLSQPYFSRVSFERVNEARTADLRKKTLQGVPNYYRLNETLVDGITGGLRDLHAAVKAAEDFEAFTEAHGGRWTLNEEAFVAFKTLTDESGSERFKRMVDDVVAALVREKMVERADVEREVRSTAGVVMLDRGDGEFLAVPQEKLTYAVNSEHVERLAEALVRPFFPVEVRPALAGIVKRAISPREAQYHPPFVFDRRHTKSVMEERLAAVQPIMDTFEAGDRLVDSGKIDAEDLALLKAEHAEYLKQRASVPGLRAEWRQRQVGIVALIAFVTIGLAVHTYRTQRRIYENGTRALALALFMLLMLLAGRLILIGIGQSPMWLVTTITMTAAILGIAYSQRFAMGAALTLALLSVITLENPFGTLVVFFTVVASMLLLLREIRRRLKMVAIGGFTAISAAIAALCVGLILQQSLDFVAREAAFAALAALAGTSLVLVLLPVIERVFRITTSLTLLEWADTGNPLLRQLIERAPGTWQHSNLIGSMAENAADEIGANGLLVRVGAYYHDIGKMLKPQYFVENQQAKINAHRGLAPTMSLLVILAHVKDGLALAREYGLPPILHQFIAEHHGTTVVRYFHAMAAQEARASGRGDRAVAESEFRYPGPKPRSRESAILMLCDGVEGAVRSLQDPTPGRIEAVVHDILMARLMDGQFDDCEITLKELASVEQSLVKSLCAIHHGRIAYPKSAGAAPARARTA